MVATITGRCSEFGGPHDTGMGSCEGLALYPARSERRRGAVP